MQARRVVAVHHVATRRLPLWTVALWLGSATEVTFALVLGQAHCGSSAILSEVGS